MKRKHTILKFDCKNFDYKFEFAKAIISSRSSKKALKIESGFICLISFCLIISVIPLGIVTGWSCSRGSKNRIDDCGVGDGVPPVDPLTLDETVGNVIHWRRKVLQFLLQFIVLLLM